MKDLADQFTKAYGDDYKNHASKPQPTVKAGDVLQTAFAKTPDQGLLARAVAAVGTRGSRADNVAALMSKNAQLWVYEDTHVPAELICSVEFTQYGKDVGPQTYRVPIELPDQLDGPFEEN
jgi:hypothetical protein